MFDNSGKATNITIVGGAVRNNAGGEIDHLSADLRPWFDFLLQDSANGAKIESALQKKNEELTIRWRDPLLTTSERLKEMSEFHEIERQLREGQDDPKQLETLLTKWKNAGLPQTSVRTQVPSNGERWCW